MIKDFIPRLYQEKIFSTCAQKNTLVVLPTGLGKTNIFLMIAAHRLKLYPGSKILLIGPTKPLIDQYLEVFKKHFEISEEEMAIFTGAVKPEKRAELWKTSKIIFSTPQGLENDILSKKIDLSEVCLLGVDECHRAVGDYAYVFVAKMYNHLARYPRIVGLTASPGSDLEKIGEVCQNLFIEDIEARTSEDPDVNGYVKDIDIKWVKVKLPPPFVQIRDYLNKFVSQRVQKLKDWGVIRRKNISFVNKTDLLGMQAELRGRAAKGEKDFVLWTAISVLAEIMKISHALELIETQGVIPLYVYLKKIKDESLTSKTKAIQNIVSDENFKSAFYLSEKLYEQGFEHPKLIELQKTVERELRQNPELKMIIFNHFRDNASDIREKLEKISGARPVLFVGQQKKGETGMSQKVQKEVIEKFRENEYNILVATCIAEEGLDIPRVDLVVFYEPIPSAIRMIQRRGRTGRQEKGRVIALMTQDTRDEGYKWSAHHKENRMHRNITDLRRAIKFDNGSRHPNNLNNFMEGDQKTKVFADFREKASHVIKELIDLGVDINLEHLENADYIVSSRCAIEFKTVEDFINSLIDGRLLEQMKNLKQSFYRPLVIVEGTEDLYSVRNVHENAIRGMIATITVSYGIPIIFSRNPKETAGYIAIIAKREQDETGKEFSPHSKRKSATDKEQQEYIVSSLPGIGMATAKDLLRKFKTVKKVMNAKEDQLKDVSNIGKLTAKKLADILDKEYTD